MWLPTETQHLGTDTVSGCNLGLRNPVPFEDFWINLKSSLKKETLIHAISSLEERHLSVLFASPEDFSPHLVLQ